MLIHFLLLINSIVVIRDDTQQFCYLFFVINYNRIKLIVAAITEKSWWKIKHWLWQIIIRCSVEFEFNFFKSPIGMGQFSVLPVGKLIGRFTFSYRNYRKKHFVNKEEWRAGYDVAWLSLSGKLKIKFFLLDCLFLSIHPPTSSR